MNAGIIIQRAFDIIMIIMIIIEEIEKNNYCIRLKIIRLRFTCIVIVNLFGTVRYEFVIRIGIVLGMKRLSATHLVHPA